MVGGMLTDFCIFHFQTGMDSSMASGNLFLDDLQNKGEVIDHPQNEDIMDCESLNIPTQAAVKPNGIVSGSVRELLECPVCCNSMYPPILQVGFLSHLMIDALLSRK